MSILNILIYIAGGLIILIYGFFAIRKHLKWKNKVKQLVANGQKLENAKSNAYNEIYKRKSNKANDVKDTPFTE